MRIIPAGSSFWTRAGAESRCYSLRCAPVTPFIGQLASAPRCAATSLLLRSCTVVLTIKRWDAPRPVSLTRGFKGHTPFIRPVFETASAASCLCHQVRLGLLLPVDFRSRYKIVDYYLSRLYRYVAHNLCGRIALFTQEVTCICGVCTAGPPITNEPVSYTHLTLPTNREV